jgi:GNAT superfamily N-acetyltransferase
MNDGLGSQENPLKTVKLRPAEIADEPFLMRVYASARAQELALVLWDEGQKQAFVEMQFAAQVQHYRTHYPAAQQLVICADDKPVGRLYLDKRPAEIRILDIAVLSENRKAGIGTLVIGNILNDALAACLPVTIYVESFNPSLQFLERLGFRKIEQDEFNVLMKWSPAGG